VIFCELLVATISATATVGVGGGFAIEMTQFAQALVNDIGSIMYFALVCLANAIAGYPCPCPPPCTRVHDEAVRPS
jgi:hypothetical protein